MLRLVVILPVGCIPDALSTREHYRALPKNRGFCWYTRTLRHPQYRKESHEAPHLRHPSFKVRLVAFTPSCMFIRYVCRAIDLRHWLRAAPFVSTSLWL